MRNSKWALLDSNQRPNDYESSEYSDTRTQPHTSHGLGTHPQSAMGADSLRSPSEVPQKSQHPQQLDLRWDRRVPSHRREAIDRLIPLALELARKAGPDGITVADLRLYAVQRGILSGQETGRQLSYLGAVLTLAGLAKSERFRRSVIEQSHGNLHRVWVAPEYGEAAA